MITCANAGVWSTEPEAIKCVLMTEGDELCNCLLSIYTIPSHSFYVASLFSTSATVAISVVSVVITFIMTLYSHWIPHRTAGDASFLS